MFDLSVILKIIRKLNIETSYSFLTLTFPLSLNIPHKKYPTLLQKFLRVSNLKHYLYAYEHKAENYHVHIICLYDYEKTFFVLKDAWSKILKESIKIKDGNAYSNSLHYSKIRDISCTLDYIFKEFQTASVQEIKEKYILLLSQKSRLFGGSSRFQRCLMRFRLTLHAHLLNSKDSVSSDSCGVIKSENEFQAIFSRVKNNYILENPNVSESLLRAQFENECNAYSCVVSRFNFTEFCEFILAGKGSKGSYTLDFYHFIKDLLTRHDILECIENQLKNTFSAEFLNTKSTAVEEFLCVFFGYDLLKQEFISFSSGSYKSFLLYRIINIIYIIFRYQSYQRLSFIVLRLSDFAMALNCGEKNKRIVDHNIRDRVRFGYFLFEFLRQKVFTKISDYIILHKVPFTQPCDTLNTDKILDEPAFAETSFAMLEELNVLLEFTSLAKNQFSSKYKHLFLSSINAFTLHYPFFVAPRSWVFSVDLISDNVEFNDSTLNTSGGLLSNNYLTETSLCRVPAYTSHKLYVTRRIIDLVNKMQVIPFCMDVDLFNYFERIKDQLPDYLSKKNKNANQKRLSEVTTLISSYYHAIDKLRSDNTLTVMQRGEAFDRLSILKEKAQSERVSLTSKLDKHNLLLRLFYYFKNLTTSSHFYFYYFLDFRMRLYPCPVEVSYMGSKFSRSLIRFAQKYPFSEREFKIYAVRQYLDCRDQNEYEILSYFESSLRLLLLDYENPQIFNKLMEAREPLLLLSCAVEWCRYQRHKSSGDSSPYLSNFPIYLDCTSNGPQLISLLFALDSFAGWLNLVKQSPSDIKGDFYNSLILKFLSSFESGPLSSSTKCGESVPVAVLQILRKSLKNVIMTQFYGISFNKFSLLIKSHFQLANHRPILMNYFITNAIASNTIESAYREFIIIFIKDFWKFLHAQTLFQLRSLLRTFHDLHYQRKPSRKNPICWSVFDMNKIFLHYKKLKKFQVDAKALKSRYQFVLYEKIDNELSSKQFSSLMANFIHSLDGYVLFRLLDYVNFPIMAVHDSFAVHSCHVELLKSNVKTIFGDLVENHKAFNYFVQQMSQMLEKDLGSEVKLQFVQFIENKIELGTLTKEDVLGSYYCITYS